MKVIYLGTPDFAVAALKRINASSHEVVGVISQPDRPANRNKVAQSKVKACAIELGLQVFTYERISKEGVADLKNLNADIMVTCAFGQILSQEILDICRLGVINIHASLLPKYRGSSPIQWAIINGEKTSGVTIMQTAKAVDSGDIISVIETPIIATETAGELFDRLSLLGADAVVEALDDIENGRAERTPQDHSKATFCKMLSKSDGEIDLGKTAKQIDCFVRGMTPWPSAYLYIGEVAVKVFKVAKIGTNNSTNQPKIGTIIVANSIDGLQVACGDGVIRLTEIQFPNGKAMKDIDYLLGHSIDVNVIQRRNNE